MFSNLLLSNVGFFTPREPPSLLDSHLHQGSLTNHSERHISQLLTADKEDYFLIISELLNRCALLQISFEFRADNQIAIAVFKRKPSQIILCQPTHLFDSDAEVGCCFSYGQCVFITNRDILVLALICDALWLWFLAWILHWLTTCLTHFSPPNTPAPVFSILRGLPSSQLTGKNMAVWTKENEKKFRH